jgi:hypothetical protein
MGLFDSTPNAQPTLTAQQAYTAWQGTPYETAVNEYINYVPEQEGWQGEGGMTGGTPASYNWKTEDSATGFQSFLQNQAAFKELSAANPETKSLLVDYEALKDDPSKVTANLLRNEYQDYLDRYAPIEQQMYDLTTFRNPGLVQQEIDQAIGADGYVSKALAGGVQQQQRSAARYGLSLNPHQQAAQDRQNNLTAATTKVHAANTIRRGLSERNDQIMLGATPNSGRAYSLRTEA